MLVSARLKIAARVSIPGRCTWCTVTVGQPHTSHVVVVVDARRQRAESRILPEMAQRDVEAIGGTMKMRTKRSSHPAVPVRQPTGARGRSERR